MGFLHRGSLIDPNYLLSTSVNWEGEGGELKVRNTNGGRTSDI